MEITNIELTTNGTINKHISANLRKRISILYVQTSSQYLLISVCLTKVKRLINLKRTNLFLISCLEPI